MGSPIRGSTILKSRRPEDHALAITLAVAFRLDAVFAYWPFFAALDAAFTTSQTSGLGSLAGEFGPESCLCLCCVGAVQGELVIAVIVGRVVSGVWIHLAEVSLVQERVVGMGRSSAFLGRQSASPSVGKSERVSECLARPPSCAGVVVSAGWRYAPDADTVVTAS